LLKTDTPNQILDINGRMRIRHKPGFTSGVWMSNSTNGLGDGAFIGLNTDTQAGIYIGEAWHFGFNSNGNAVLRGLHNSVIPYQQELQVLPRPLL
jgi:hypothetical protein